VANLGLKLLVLILLLRLVLGYLVLGLIAGFSNTLRADCAWLALLTRCDASRRLRWGAYILWLCMVSSAGYFRSDSMVEVQRTLLHDLGSLSLGLKMPWLAHIEGEVDWVDAHVEQSLNASGVLGRLLQAG
jgi:hypothetical protein